VGSIKRYLTKQGEPHWRASVYAGRTPDGRERRINRNFAEKRAAEVWLAEQTRAKATGMLAVPSRQTVGEFFDQWVRDYGGNLAPTTKLRYEQLLNLHLRPTLGSLRLGQLRPQDITRLLTRKLQEGKLSATTLLHVYRLLHKVLRDGVLWGVLPANPADRVKPPRPAEFEPIVFDVETARVFLAEAKRSSPYYRVYLFASLGMRSGEIAGLQWDQVNLLTGQIAVIRKLYRLKGQPLISEPKTRYGRRAFTLPGIYLDELRALKQEQDAAKALLGDCYEDHNLVFAQRNGKPLWMTMTVAEDFRRVLKKCKLDTRMRIHDLRHSAASILAALGVDAVTISRILGHHSAGFTLSRYGHLLPGAMDGALARLESSLFSSKESGEREERR
jgi:integrase